MIPRQHGFKEGYRTQINLDHDFAGPPPAPYPLRSEDRHEWLRGWCLGINLARIHLKAVAQTLADIEREANPER